MEKTKTISLIIVDVLLLFALVGLTTEVFKLKRFAFYGEFFLTLLFVALVFIGLVAAFNSMRWGSVLLSFSSILIIADLLLVYALAKRPDIILVISLLAAALSLVLAALSIGKNEDYLTKAADGQIEEIEPVEKKGKKKGK
ncbi:MAG TPA: hypothetical protein VJI46_04520 [Candidatus Nanoarchaeia archaeon]|nr:hypothetical protein [Candidatus Nanoarchaeia archaeon]